MLILSVKDESKAISGTRAIAILEQIVQMPKNSKQPDTPDFGVHVTFRNNQNPKTNRSLVVAIQVVQAIKKRPVGEVVFFLSDTELLPWPFLVGFDDFLEKKDASGVPFVIK